MAFRRIRVRYYRDLKPNATDFFALVIMYCRILYYSTTFTQHQPDQPLKLGPKYDLFSVNIIMATTAQAIARQVMRQNQIHWRGGNSQFLQARCAWANDVIRAQ
jgi:hypothetical protein